MKHIVVLLSLISNVSWANAQVVLHEMQSSNASTHSDEFGEFDDWIELRNIGSQSVDVGGWVLKDQLDTWMIPVSNAATFLFPGEYLLLWADDQEVQGVFHTNFKLSAANGEFLGLYGPDSITVVDSVTIPPLNADQSFGHCENGFEVFSVPTPLAENSCSVGVIDQEKSDAFDVFVDQNSKVLHMNFNQLQLEVETILIYNLSGVVILELDAAQSTIDVSHLSSGTYILSTNLEGISRKFTVL